MKTLEKHLDNGNAADSNSRFKRDDASIIDRNHKIEDMRKRVERQLAALVEGNDLNALQQQVAELRTPTNGETFRGTFEEEEGFNNSGSFLGGGGSMHKKTPLDDESAVTLDSTASSKYIDQKELVDPYGDAGTYTGEIAVVTAKPNGLGTMNYADGRTFSGGWNHGQWHGKGVLLLLLLLLHVMVVVRGDYCEFCDQEMNMR